MQISKRKLNRRAAFTALVLGLSTALAPTAAHAHKAKDNHTHCSVGGKGFGVQGKTDAERKTNCGKLPGSAWDESKILRVENDTNAAPQGPASPSKPTTPPTP